MTAREKLKDEDRAALLDSGTATGKRIVRIIDAQEAIIAHMSANIAAVKHDHEHDRAALVKERDAAIRALAYKADESMLVSEVARLTALDKGLRIELSSRDAEVARLTEALGQAREQATHWAELSQKIAASAEAAEQKLAEAAQAAGALALAVDGYKQKLAEAEQNFGMLTDANASITVALNAAEARLATAAELIREGVEAKSWNTTWVSKSRAFLANQPAAFTTATELLSEARRALDDMLERYQAMGLTSIKAQAIATKLRAFLANQPAAEIRLDERAKERDEYEQQRNAAEQKLAAAEHAQTHECTYLDRAQAAESRCRELEAELASSKRAHDLTIDTANARIDEAESELTQLRELLRAASLAMPAPWPLPRETGLAIQEALRGPK